jgi:sugar phosphate isomerase/epimerase
MKLGISSFTYGWAVGIPGADVPAPLTALDLVDRASRLDVRVVQIADNLPLHRLALEERRQLARRAADQGISLEVGTRGIAAEHLRQYLAIAVELGSPILRVVIDTVHDRPAIEEIVSKLRPLVPAFEAVNVCLAIENHDRLPAPDLLRILGALDSPAAGICLDTANSLGALEGPRETVEALAPHTVNLHLKDVAARRAPSQLGLIIEGTPAGAGQLDLPWIVAQVSHNGRGANAILEQWTPPEDSLEATVPKEARWAEESIRYLRTIIPE